jgi:ATP-dependent Lon protease
MARFTECRFRRDCAVSAELTLSGLLFPVGAIEEKLQAAKTYGVKRVIISLLDYEVLSDAWKQDPEVEVVSAKSALELINLCLAGGQGKADH